MSKKLFKLGMYVQVGQNSYTLQDDEITTKSRYVYLQYQTFKKKNVLR